LLYYDIFKNIYLDIIVISSIRLLTLTVVTEIIITINVFFPDEYLSRVTYGPKESIHLTY